MNRTGPSLTQAVLEGVAFAFRDSLEALRLAGTEPVAGDRDRRRLALSLLAANRSPPRSEMPVDIPADGDFGAAFGAARLGLIAAERALIRSPSALRRPQAKIEPEDRTSRRL
jgi:xylulokinase